MSFKLVDGKFVKIDSESESDSNSNNIQTQTNVQTTSTNNDSNGVDGGDSSNNSNSNDIEFGKLIWRNYWYQNKYIGVLRNNIIGLMDREGSLNYAIEWTNKSAQYFRIKTQDERFITIQYNKNYGPYGVYLLTTTSSYNKSVCEFFMGPNGLKSLHTDTYININGDLAEVQRLDLDFWTLVCYPANSGIQDDGLQLNNPNLSISDVAFDINEDVDSGEKGTGDSQDNNNNDKNNNGGDSDSQNNQFHDLDNRVKEWFKPLDKESSIDMAKNLRQPRFLKIGRTILYISTGIFFYTLMDKTGLLTTLLGSKQQLVNKINEIQDKQEDIAQDIQQNEQQEELREEQLQEEVEELNQTTQQLDEVGQQLENAE